MSVKGKQAKKRDEVSLIFQQIVDRAESKGWKLLLSHGMYSVDNIFDAFAAISKN